MKTLHRIAAVGISFSTLLIITASPLYASGACTPVYGGGVVCPTPTPAPQLPSAGIESLMLPGLGSILAGGAFVLRKAKKV